MTTPGQLKRRAQLYEQLAATIAAGLPLMQALEMASRNRALSGSRATIMALIGHLKDGLTFADSMAKIAGWIPEFDRALLSAGEQSGRLDDAFRQLARNYAARARIIRDTLKKLIVTMVTLHVFLIVFPLGLLIAFAWGIMDGNYERCIPFIIQKFVAFGFMYGAAFFVIYACQGNRSEFWRATMERMFIWVPLLRPAMINLAVARLTAALEALLNAGVPVIRSWELAAAASGSPRLKRDILAWTPHLERGVTPAEMISQINYLPEMFTHQYLAAETSGKHDETLQRLQIYFEEEGFNSLEMFAKVLNGIVYGTVVAIVVYNVISFWVHYYGNMINTINNA
jgi:type II secretory pathway component PulF